MATTRSYTNAFEIVDYTQELQIVPNSWTLLNDSGLFAEEFLSTNTVTFEEQAKTLGLIGDQYRGAKPQANKDDNRKIRSYPIAHFPIVEAVTPDDIQGKRAYGSQDQAETEAAVLARKMERIRKNMDITLEVGRFSTLTTGNLYAPNGTIAGNLFSDFGISQTSVDFVLGTATTDIVAKVETVIAAMQDNAQTGDVITGVLAYCSPEWFAKLISHAKIVDAYKYFSATEGQMIQRNRAGGNNGLYREFTYAGIRFVEVRTVLAGQRLIPAGEVVFVPTGTSDTFVSYFGPANRMDFVNTIAERGYMWTYRDPKGQGIDIDGEFNVTHMIRRPALVIKGTSSN
jgi:hypothetical protein